MVEEHPECPLFFVFQMRTILRYIKRQKAARSLFRATRLYNGFKNLDLAPKGLKKTCYYYGICGGSSDAAMVMLTSPRGRSAYIKDIEELMGIMHNAYLYGSTFYTLADYLCVMRYLKTLSSFARLFPLTWWVGFHLPHQYAS